jgi:hypothetical protein
MRAPRALAKMQTTSIGFLQAPVISLYQRCR